MIINTHPASAEVERVSLVLAAVLGGFPSAYRDVAVRCVEAVESAAIDRAIYDLEARA